MNQEIRNRLRNVVTQCRRLLEESITEDLEGKFGIFARNGQVTADPNAPMTHLSDEERAARTDILDHFEHIKARGFKPKDALDQLIREIAFTHLNRFCAYKMMEARDVYVGGQKFREAVSRGVHSNGVKFYLADHPDDERKYNSGQQDVAYRHFLDWLGSLLSDEIGILFSPNDPANRLYPRQSTLDEVLNLLSTGGMKPDETELRDQWPSIWLSDETIGWVYQYFTPKELRDQARKESQAPRNSYELAFRNQFFTPRYVVEFLTDNTLGRIWYEMRKGDTKLKEQCPYMVRRPTEIFLKEGKQPPIDAAAQQGDLTKEELLRLPLYVPHRPKKDPRDLRVLDPASGSGHFLLYCFDLLLTIYEEAYSDPDLGPTLQAKYETLDALRRDVPRLILAHNIHGIDIDLRASQIAALALWLRCQRAYQEIGLKKARPNIMRSNLVCAEPMPGEAQLLKDFVAQLEPKLLGQIVEVVFERMKLAGETGSLLTIEEEIRDVVAAAKKQWVRESSHAIDRKGQPLLFTQSVMDRLLGKAEQSTLFDLSGITDAQFFEQAELKVVEALREYSATADNGHRLQKRLFTDDAERGFAFVDLCHKRYDVLLMNPPFGSSVPNSDDYLRETYPTSYYDLYSAFMMRAHGLLGEGGRIGCITSKTFFANSRLRDLRKWLLSEAALDICIDFGWSVMEATVEAAACVIQPMLTRPHVMFIDATSIDHRQQTLLLAANAKESDSVYHVLRAAILAFPNIAFAAYWGSKKILSLFNSVSQLDPHHAETAAGQMTGDDFRFVRAIWEVGCSSGSRWRPFIKGGDFFRYYSGLHLLIDWTDEAVGEYRKQTVRSVLLSRRSADFLNRSAIAWNRIHENGFNVRAIPSNAKFSDKAPAVFPKDDPSFLLGVLCSKTISQLCEIQNPNRMYEVRDVSALPVPCADRALVSDASVRIWQIKQQWASTIDPNAEYRHPPSALAQQRSISQGVEVLRAELQRDDQSVADLHDAIDQEVARGFGLTDVDHLLLNRVASDFPRECAVLEFTGGVDKCDRKFWTRQILSYLLGVVFGRWDLRKWQNSNSPVQKIDPFAPIPLIPPGSLVTHYGNSGQVTSDDYSVTLTQEPLLVDDRDHSDDIIRRIRETLELTWRDAAYAVETEVCEIFGIDDLREYFRKSGNGGFWDDHISRYSKSRRRAPVYWLLQSSKRSYAIWLYYHGLDKDLLFKALVKYVEPKIRLESSRLNAFRTQKSAAGESGKEGRRLAKDMEEQEDLLSELRDFEEKLRRAANLHLTPDLNDGVLLNLAPLHELVPWKSAKVYWEELLEGKYEWSSIGKQLRQKGLVR